MPRQEVTSERLAVSLGMESLLASIKAAAAEGAHQAVSEALGSPPDEWLTPREACEYMKVSHTRLYELLGDGLESVVIGGGRSRRVSRSAIDKFLRGKQAES